MNNSNELLQLLTNLAQMKDKQEIIISYIDNLNKLFSPLTFIHVDCDPEDNRPVFPVATHTFTHGFIIPAAAVQLTKDDNTSLYISSQMLAIVLDNIVLSENLHGKRASEAPVVEELPFRLEKNREYSQESDNLFINQSENHLDKHTEQKQVETLLREKEYELDQFFLSAIDLLCIADTDGYFLQLNKEWERVLGYRIEDLEGKRFLDLVHPDDVEATLEAIEELKSQKEILNFTNRYLGKDGSFRWIEWRSIPNGKLIYAAARDITERKQIEEDLQLEKEFRQRVFDGSRVAIIVMDATTHKFIDCNPAAVEIHQYKKRSEILGKTPTDFSASVQYDGTPSKDKARYFINKALKDGEIVFEWRNRHPDGEIWDAEVHLMSFQTKQRNLLQFTLQDITERKRAEIELLREKQFNEKLLESLPGIFFLYDQTCHLKRWNKAHETVMGFTADELRDWFISDWHETPEEAEKGLAFARQVLETGVGGAFETTLKNKQGDYVPYLVSVNRLLTPEGPFMMGVGIDITERKQAEEEKEKLQDQLIQAQKIESIGRLAGGVAHDFNNMLQAILGNTELAMAYLEPENRVREFVGEIKRYALHSADLTRQLLAFARKQTIAPMVLDLNETVSGMLKMLRRLIGEDIDLQWLPGENLGLVNMDPSQIDQILANLCINARDAIGLRVGKITIETANAVFNEEYCVRHAGYLPGDYILLAVSDDGSGMDAETLAHVFEPFFTTKELGKGTGLGLATVYGVIRQNKGFINVYSEVDHGTTFRIFLPQHTAESESRSDETPIVETSGGETILLVEDETAILQMVAAMLESIGYTVLTSKTPDEAIRMAKDHSGQIDLLMTDVVMPEMNGRDLSNSLISIYPDIKCLFMSGYTANVIAHHGVLDKGVHFIQKPFTTKTLTAKVHQVLTNE